MTSDFHLTTAIQPPPGPEAQLQLPNNSSANPPIFNDAMIVRMRVFVDEQHCSADAEIDVDDARSWHWVMYRHSPTAAIPVAVIRLVPPPQPPHTHPQPVATQHPLQYDWSHEPCVKLTRVAVLPEYRGLGLGRRLVETALTWASEHGTEINDAVARWAARCNWTGPCAKWEGLVLVHAQVDVERMYQAMGFQTDQSLGRWDEEGIEHVGLFRRIEVLR
ncbi:Acyl-CoA N-acyltransferase [Penicillium capsulatum]|uniref:Glucosamine 6-phosphate N-acetyltransferase n=1 Tax=Penicillium capsulatum TaxID=69766 RepID=A0A9W9I2S3_9EURO|nr:Acyl-CoA N-acyltransferase [Penicillium capsulatum]KAJ6116236.1 Acyl-CoA N-acyltransferase [Penicillium capsulatum]